MRAGRGETPVPLSNFTSTWGRDLLPIDLGWFTFTPAVNTFAMIFWPLALIALVYFGWMHKGRSTVTASAASRTA